MSSPAGERTLAGAFFSRTAERSSGDRRNHLQSAAAGYTEAGRLMQAIRDGLPESRSGVLSEEDSLRQVAIGELKPLLRRARDAERRALSALVELLEERPLPPVREDPLLRRDRGRQLFVWTATLSKGVYNLSLSG